MSIVKTAYDIVRKDLNNFLRLFEFAKGNLEKRLLLYRVLRPICLTTPRYQPGLEGTFTAALSGWLFLLKLFFCW